MFCFILFPTRFIKKENIQLCGNVKNFFLLNKRKTEYHLCDFVIIPETAGKSAATH